MSDDTLESTSGESCTYTLFQLVDHSSSRTVVQCFLGLLITGIVMELSLEKLEDAVQGSVVQEVLEKLYKELMILGFVSFGIFILLTSFGDTLNIRFISSFEYAHFVMFFVGVGLILQAAWTIKSNKTFQRNIWRASGADTRQLLEDLKGTQQARKWFSFYGWIVQFTKQTFEYQYLSLQTYRMIFLMVHDLPNSFLFAHYTCTSLNAITVGFMNLQPSSYTLLALSILISESLIRNHPRYLYGTMVDSPNGNSLSLEHSAIVFATFGFILCLINLFLLRILRKGCFQIVKGYLEVNNMNDAFKLLTVFNQQTSEETETEGTGTEGTQQRKSGQRKARTLSKLGRDFQFLLDPNGRFLSNQGGVGVGMLPGQHQNASSLTLSVTANTDDDDVKDSELEMSPVSPPASPLGTWTLNGTISKRNSFTRELEKTGRSSSLKRSPSDVEKDRRKKKTNKMLKQHKSTGRTKRNSALELALLNDKSWSNADAEVIGEAARDALPFKSMSVTLKMVDAVKVFKVFFLSIAITSFTENSKHLSAGVQFYLWGSFICVVAASLFLDPLLTYQYGLLTTMACVNPLLIGETIEYMSDVDYAVHMLSRWIVSEHSKHIRRNFRNSDYSDEVLFQLLKIIFNEWDTNHSGEIGRRSFMNGISRLKLGQRQKNAMFKEMDIDLNRTIVFGEFCVRLGPHLRHAIQEYFALKAEYRRKKKKPLSSTDLGIHREEEEERKDDDDNEESDDNDDDDEEEVEGRGALQKRLNGSKKQTDAIKEEGAKRDGSFNKFLSSGFGISI